MIKNLLLAKKEVVRKVIDRKDNSEIDRTVARYDKNGCLVECVDHAEKFITRFSYDSKDRCIQSTNTDIHTGDVSVTKYTYSHDDRIESEFSKEFTRRYYNIPLGDQNIEMCYKDDELESMTIRNKHNNISKMTVEGEYSINYTYDENNNLIKTITEYADGEIVECNMIYVNNILYSKVISRDGKITSIRNIYYNNDGTEKFASIHQDGGNNFQEIYSYNNM